MRERSIFRQVALERLSSPEQLDQLMQVTNSMAWVALVTLGLLLLAALVWGVTGYVPVQVVGQGILLAPGGVQDVVALSAGQVTALNVQAGDRVQAGQTIAYTTGPEQNSQAVVSPQSGRVLEIKVNQGGLVERGTPILSLESDQTRLEVVAYLPPTEGKKVQPGMAAQISPSTVRPEEHGFMLGQVVSVGAFPATRSGMLRVLGSEELAQALAVSDAPIEVRVDLTPDPQTPSGYAWSSSQGPPMPVGSGTLCRVSIIIRQERPINLVLPVFK